MKTLMLALFFVASAVIVLAPSNAAASPRAEGADAVQLACFPRNFACPPKDEGFQGNCCSGLRCRNGICDL